jgi:hypothetical protein
MDLRRVAKQLSTLVLVVGLVTIGAAPADATAQHKHSAMDTGWGFK